MTWIRSALVQTEGRNEFRYEGIGLYKFAELGGRAMLAALFLLAGIGKITGFAATAGYMASQGVPGVLLPLVIALEVLGALAIIVGWKTRVVSAALFHANLADQMQMTMFLKNIAIAGGFLLLMAHGAGPLSPGPPSELIVPLLLNWRLP